MAKRKRLSPVTLPEESAASTSAPRSGLAPPIAQMAGASAAFSAARSLEDQMDAARNEGRLIVSLPLEAIEEAHLMRDRMGVDALEMDALKASLLAHGQRTAIEVEDLGQGRYGLISGWRRLTALKALHQETGKSRFGKVAALLRAPEDRADAYIAMVEENEIRTGLSYYERARVAARAAEQGAFESPEAAVNALFGAGSRARRSKIRSFLRIHDVLGAALSFPTYLPERLGLKLAEAIKAGEGNRLSAGLNAKKSQTPEAEAATLLQLLKGKEKADPNLGQSKAVLLKEQGLELSANKAGAGFSFTFKGARADPALRFALSELLVKHLQSKETTLK